METTAITVDGLDATEKLIEILAGWKFNAILLSGVSFAGFNLIDPIVLFEKFEKPVIVISRKKPDNKAVKRALQRHFDDWETRWKIVEKLGRAHKVTITTDEPPIYVETIGCDIKWACALFRFLSVCARIPEPVRVARLIARGTS